MGLLLPVTAQTVQAPVQSGRSLDGYRNMAPIVVVKDQLPAEATAYEQALNALHADDKSRAQTIFEQLLSLNGQHERAFLYFLVGDKLAQDRFQRFVQLLQAGRMDQQFGSGANSSGSTSLVSKPSTTAVLSAAVETGALTQSSNGGPETTFRGNAVGIGRMFFGEEPFPFCPPKQISCDSPFVKALNGLNFSISVDNNGQKTTTVPISGSATPPPAGSMPPAVPSSVDLASNSTRVSAWSLRYGFYNHRNPNDQKYRAAYDQALRDGSAELVSAAGALLEKFRTLNALETSAAYQKWLKDATAHMVALGPGTDDSRLADQLSSQLNDLKVILRGINPDFENEAIQALESLDVYFSTRQQMLATIKGGGNMFTFEYTNNAPLNSPRTSDFRLIFAWQPAPRVMLTLNGAGTIYNTLPTGVTVGRWRDAQVAGQVDIAMGQLGTVTTPIVSAAGYFQYMHDPALITIGTGDLAPNTNIQLPGNAVTLLGVRGNIAIGQVKLTFPLRNSGVSIPLAVTWANRSDLLPSNGVDVTAHFGLSFNMDGLLSTTK